MSSLYLCRLISLIIYIFLFLFTQRKALEFVDDDQDEQGIIKEDNITPHRSTTVVRNKAPKKPKSHQQDEQPNMGMNAGQKALMDGINDKRKIQIEDFLTASPELPVYGSDPVSYQFYRLYQQLLNIERRNSIDIPSSPKAEATLYYTNVLDPFNLLWLKGLVFLR